MKQIKCLNCDEIEHLEIEQVNNHLQITCYKCGYKNDDEFSNVNELLDYM